MKFIIVLFLFVSCAMTAQISKECNCNTLYEAYKSGLYNAESFSEFKAIAATKVGLPYDGTYEGNTAIMNADFVVSVEEMEVYAAATIVDTVPVITGDDNDWHEVFDYSDQVLGADTVSVDTVSIESIDTIYNDNYLLPSSEYFIAGVSVYHLKVQRDLCDYYYNEFETTADRSTVHKRHLYKITVDSFELAAKKIDEQAMFAYEMFEKYYAKPNGINHSHLTKLGRKGRDVRRKLAEGVFREFILYLGTEESSYMEYYGYSQPSVAYRNLAKTTSHRRKKSRVRMKPTRGKSGSRLYKLFPNLACRKAAKM